MKAKKAIEEYRIICSTLGIKSGDKKCKEALAELEQIMSLSLKASKQNDKIKELEKSLKELNNTLEAERDVFANNMMEEQNYNTCSGCIYHNWTKCTGNFRNICRRNPLLKDRYKRDKEIYSPRWKGSWYLTSANEIRRIDKAKADNSHRIINAQLWHYIRDGINKYNTNEKIKKAVDELYELSEERQMIVDITNRVALKNQILGENR